MKSIEAKDLKPFEGKTVATLTKLATLHFNRWIRLRDSEDGYFKCISCGVTKSIDTCNAGHYIAAPCSATRYDEINVNGQCVACNCYNHGALIGYREGLVKKYGEDAVKDLEDRSKVKPRKKERVELMLIILRYRGRK